MATVRERLETLPVAELAEVREKLRLNAEEREALEATARRLLEAWGGVDEPPSPPAPPAEPPAPPPARTSVVINPLADRVAAGNASFAELTVWTLNSNLGKNYSALDLAGLWKIRSGIDVETIRSALARCAARGTIRRVAHGRYTSIYSS